MRCRLRTLLQFRLSTLLIAVTVFGVWLGVQVNRANRQKRAVAAIEKARGVIHFDFQRDADGQRIPDAKPPGPAWLRKLLGDEYFRKVVLVGFDTEYYGRRKELGLSKVDDEGLRCFASLPDVEMIYLDHNRAVTDQGLMHLHKLTKLRVLSLYECNVTGEGFVYLRNLTSLENLALNQNPLTKEGLATLGQLTGLTSLSLSDMPIADDDLEALRPLINLTFLRLNNTAITDKGLPHLRPLINLKSLELGHTSITDGGLHDLEEMSGLETLHLPAGISEEGLQQIRRALPNCRIGRDRR